jgi:hypothetical protein
VVVDWDPSVAVTWGRSMEAKIKPNTLELGNGKNRLEPLARPEILVDPTNLGFLWSTTWALLASEAVTLLQRPGRRQRFRPGQLIFRVAQTLLTILDRALGLKMDEER